jgi:hypothetical protein
VAAASRKSPTTLPIASATPPAPRVGIAGSARSKALATKNDAASVASA